MTSADDVSLILAWIGHQRVLTATPRNLPMTVSRVCSYSFNNVFSCLFSCCSVWFSSTRWDAKASSSVWNSSAVS